MTYTTTRNEQYKSFEIAFDGIPDKATRETLKANGYKWHGVRKIWYGYKDIADVLNGAENASDSPKTQNSDADREQQQKLMDRYMLEHSAAHPNADEKYTKWLRGQIARIVELDNGELLEIEKPRIETSFCFGYGQNGVSTPEEYNEAYNAMRHAETSESRFIKKNLEQLTATIEKINAYTESEQPDYCGSVPLTPYLCNRYGTKTKSLTFMRGWDYDDIRPSEKSHYRKPTANELQHIITAYEIEIKAFEKRLQTYLKRYGLTKLHTWTYLSD